MKYAICYRGISFIENYSHKDDIPSYTIDFANTIPFNRKYLIDPLLERGDEVDIFFNTYDSEKFDYFEKEMNPVAVRTSVFDNNIKYCNWPNIWQISIDTMEMVDSHQKVSGKWYDYIILFRYDLIPYMDFSKIFIPMDAVSCPSPQDDMFTVIPGYLLSDVLHLFKEFKYSGMIHNYTAILSHFGIKCHTMFTKDFDRDSYPFFRNTRHIFVPEDHPYYEHKIEDIFDPNHKKYGLKYEAHDKFVSCV
jgi:hypothetical protein